MGAAEISLGILLAAALVGLAGFFAWRQFTIRRALVHDRNLLPEERKYLIRQTRRRLFVSMMMFLLAGFLVGWFFIEDNLPNLKAAVAQEPGQPPPLLELVAIYWTAALLLVLGILVLAGMDFFATARHGLHQKKLLENERRTALKLEAGRLKSQRNGS